MHLHIRHLTEYTYPQSQKRVMQVLRLHPQHSDRQKVINWYVDTPHVGRTSFDAYGNLTHHVCLQETESYFRIEARGVIETNNIPWQMVKEELSPFVFLRSSTSTQINRDLWVLLEPYKTALQTNRQAGVEALSAAILASVPFTLGVSHAHTSAAQALENAGGVCQDHAHILIACCRAAGIPARYVSGYLYSNEHTHPQEASHAWAQVWLPEHGWLGVDVANQCWVNAHYVQVAVGLDYYDASPIRGVRVGMGAEDMKVQVWVDRI